MANIFDNYVSSPATPILGSIISIIMGLNSKAIMLLGIVYILVLVIYSKTLIGTFICLEKGKSLVLSFPIIALSFINFSYALIGNYYLASLS
ncbi:MAG: hypothetical protein QW076_05075, partial [Candidatus Anstonellales archaeon]